MRRFGCCWFIVLCTTHCLWGSVLVFVLVCIALCFCNHLDERESWLLCFNCLSYVLLLLMFCGCASRCCELVCSVWLWYFLIILTYLFYLCSNLMCASCALTGLCEFTDIPKPSLLAYEILQSGSIIAFDKHRDLARLWSLHDSNESACMCRVL